MTLFNKSTATFRNLLTYVTKFGANINGAYTRWVERCLALLFILFLLLGQTGRSDGSGGPKMQGMGRSESIPSKSANKVFEHQESELEHSFFGGHE